MASKKIKRTGHAASLLVASGLALMASAPLALATPIDVSQAPARAAVSPSGSLAGSTQSVGVNNPSYDATFDTAPDYVDLFGGGIDDRGQNQAASIPEPATALLLGLGLLGFGLARRKN